MYYFIYETTNIVNQKKYRGYHSTDNIDDGYLGSGVAIKKAIKKYGVDNFKREILEFCKSLDEVLVREKFYVDEVWVKSKNNYNLVLGGKNIRQTIESRKNLGNTIKRNYYSGNGKVFGNKIGDKKVVSAETKRKISEKLKLHFIENDHPGKGKIPWNKGSEGLQKAWNKGKKTGPLTEKHKESISNSTKKRLENGHHNKGKKLPWSEEKRMTYIPPNKGVKAEEFLCPHCHKTIGGKTNFNRWHNNNCKNKEI